jgi:hypothetical protein
MDLPVNDGGGRRNAAAAGMVHDSNPHGSIHYYKYRDPEVR